MQDIITDRNSSIMYRRWAAPEPKAVLLLVHGLGAHSGRWEFLAEFFLKANISSYALELKGFGETKSLKGHIDSFNTYYTDIKHLYRIADKENKQKKIFLLGESMGALISLEAVIAEPSFFEGLICISPAFASAMSFSFWEYLKIFSSLLYAPKKQFEVPFESAMCTRDEEYIAQMDQDPREHRLATARLLFEIAKLQILAVLSKKDLGIDVLFLLAGEDKLVDAKVTETVFKKIVSRDKIIVRYPKMYHALSIDIEREKVFKDMLGWMEQRL